MKKFIFAASFALAIIATACSGKATSDKYGEGLDSVVVEETTEVVCDSTEVCPADTCTDTPCTHVHLEDCHHAEEVAE